MDRRTGPVPRCRRPGGTAFATKPKLARQMIARALDAGAPAAWVAGDEVYGADPGLRTELETRGIGYVLAVAKSHPVHTGTGACRADQLAARAARNSVAAVLSRRRRQGPPLLRLGLGQHRAASRPGHRWLLIRRNHRTGELAFYRCYSARPVPLAALVKVAGRRWTVEEDFQASKGLAGLDEHQVRRWDSWHRWITLAMLAAAFLTIAAAAERATRPPPDGQIPLTRNEIARLLATLIIQPLKDAWHRLRWSAWRRRHQHRARTCHYQRQAREP